MAGDASTLDERGNGLAFVHPLLHLRLVGLAGALLAASLPGCGSGEAVVVPDADPPLPEGCVDITVGTELLPTAESWRQSEWMPRHPFWVDERGVHAAWVASREGSTAERWLIVSSFDRETGEHLRSRIYDPFGREPGTRGGGLWDVAASPDGVFGGLAHEGSDSAPGGVLEHLALGQLNDPAVLVLADLPWTRAEAAAFHVGWDGETFAVHALDLGSPGLRLARFSPDGALVQDRTVAGRVRSLEESYSAFHTDAETGRSWLATQGDVGPWLSAHERDGALLPGMEAQGGVVVEPQQVDLGAFYFCVGVASRGGEAMLAWYDGASTYSETRLQRVRDAQPEGAALVIDGDEDTGNKKALTQSGGRWWMGMLKSGAGVESYWLSDTEQLSREPLVPLRRCSPTCGGVHHDLFDIRNLSAFSRQDEVWFGFWDYSDQFNVSDEHPTASSPYRIVLVKEGCWYRTHWEKKYPEQ